MQALATTDAYEVDIITGASAGATTASLIAHALLYKEGKTALHDVWVKKVDISDMLADDLDQGDDLSLLTSRPLRKLAQDTLRWDGPVSNAKHASFCASELTLAMTISNVTPLPYIAEVKQPTATGEEGFVQRRHSEQETFTLDDAFGPKDDRWARITEVALASSAIPLVFPSVLLERQSR
jgi:predicted acylesterase/phospholipase RssA